MNNFKNKYLIFIIVTTLVFIADCKDPRVEQKLDSKLKTNLIRLKETSQLNKRITILFRVNEELTDLHHVVLKKRGVKIRANIGDVYTATIPAKSIYGLAKMRFIDYIQGQMTLKTLQADSTSNSTFKEK